MFKVVILIRLASDLSDNLLGCVNPLFELNIIMWSKCWLTDTIHNLIRSSTFDLRTFRTFGHFSAVFFFFFFSNPFELLINCIEIHERKDVRCWLSIVSDYLFSTFWRTIFDENGGAQTSVQKTLANFKKSPQLQFWSNLSFLRGIQCGV